LAALSRTGTSPSPAVSSPPGPCGRTVPPPAVARSTGPGPSRAKVSASWAAKQVV
ncbi:STK33, partial [Symbiodinium natans]